MDYLMKYELAPMFDSRRLYYYWFYIHNGNEYCRECVVLQGSKNQNLHLMRVVRKCMIEALAA
jgi:hypothetical protein